MAKKQAGVWGIDIGQCAFKALRCVADGDRVVADAFEYIEYPKMLSQPEADTEQLIRDAVEKFVDRNDIRGDQISISVPGQSGLSKFFKPPPVDVKKIPDLVKFEARQQIPFDLNDVIWTYQQLGGVEADGFVVDTEIGLFAMKREQVLRAMEPYEEVGLELDVVQLAPLAIYNFVTYDIMSESLAGEFNPDDPPESLVLLSMGTDTTDLVITNGFRMWQRSIPLGGNHFTRQLTKSLKLTFAKAEHLKRNARRAEDPKKVFTAMRPVFTDMLSEIQRSIGYFQSLDRKAKIGGVVMLGNTVRLPGLKQFLAKNLGYKMVDFERFRRLGGGDLLSAPAFKDNVLSFGVCYGLCLQSLGQSQLRTSLLPPEIATDRIVRAKKPWAVASIAALITACWAPYLLEYRNWRLVEPSRQTKNVSWQQATDEVSSVQSLSSQKQSEDSQLVSQLDKITAIGEELVGNADRRLIWLEMLKAINAAMPTTPGLQPGEIPDIEEKPLEERQELHVEYVENKYSQDLSSWFNDSIERKYLDVRPQPAEPNEAEPKKEEPAESLLGGATATPEQEKLEPPAGAGWVVEMRLHHFFNSEIQLQGATHVQQTLLKNLETGSVVLPAPANKLLPGVNIINQGKPLLVEAVTSVVQPPQGNNPATRIIRIEGSPAVDGKLQQVSFASEQPVGVIFTFKDLGISYPVIVWDQKIIDSQVPNPDYTPAPDESGYGGDAGSGSSLGPTGAGSGIGGLDPGGGDEGNEDPAASDPAQEEDEVPKTLPVRRYDCVVQFAWKETLMTDRIEVMNQAWEQAKKNQPPSAQDEGGAVAQN